MQEHGEKNFKENFSALCIFIKSLFTKAIIYEEIDIHGDKTFGLRIIEAIKLLEARSPEACLIVKQNVDVIYQGKKDKISTFGVGAGSLMIDATDQTTTWIAGKIYFEAKRIDLINKIQKKGRLFMAPEEYAYKKIADEHYASLKQIGAD